MRARLLPQASLAGLLMMAGAALANPLTDDLVAQLRGQGFEKVTITRTLLGRVLILGSADAGQREIVLNPNTGEILRDYFRPRAEMAPTSSSSHGTLLVRDLSDGGAGANGDDQTATGPTDAPGGGRDKPQNGKGNQGKGAGNNGKTKEK